MNAIIYKFTNTVNNKIYIGQTFNEKSRYSAHKNSEKHLDTHNSYFHHAIAKYGFNKFTYEVLVSIPYLDNFKNSVKEILDSLEIMYISMYNSSDKEFGYNITLGGGGTLGKPLSEEHKDKISKALKAKNIHLNDNQREALKNRNIPENHKGKEILKYSLNGDFLEEFDSITKAAQSVKGNDIVLSRIITRETNKGIYKGFFWKFKNDPSEIIINISRNPKAKPIKQYSKQGDLINTWEAMIDAAEYFNKSLQTFSAGIKRNPEGYLGYKWELVS